MTKIVNLTPHSINIIGLTDMENGEGMHHIFPDTNSTTPCTICGAWRDEGCDVPCGITISPSGIVARVKEKMRFSHYVNGIPVMIKVTGGIENLPESEKDTVFIVSFPVVQMACRRDVIAIGELVRDGKGNVIGARSLVVI